MAKENNKKSKKEEKNKKHFLKDFKAELKRVVWLTPKQLTNNTIAVITIVLIIAIIVFMLDLSFRFLNEQNTKLQENLQSKYSNSEEVENIDTSISSEETGDASNEVDIDTNVTETIEE